MGPGHVQGFLLGHDVLVWSPEGVQYLRQEWRIVGGMIGALPHKPRQNNELGLPCLLMPEEVAFLSKKGILEMCRDATSPVEKDTLTTQHSPPDTHSVITGQYARDKVFQDLWERGYYMTSGLKYGGHFLVYTDDPSQSHSTFIALVLSWQQHLSLPALARVAGKVKKKVLLCSPKDDQIHYFTLEWAGMP